VRRVALGGLLALALALPGTALAAPGDVYVADEDSNVAPPSSGAIFKVTPSGAVTVVGTDPAFSNPGGIALLPSGKLAVPDYSATPPRVAILNPENGQVRTLAAGPPLVDPYDAALAADGSLLVADHGADQLFKINLATGTVAPFATLPPSGFGAVVASVPDGAVVAVQDALLLVDSRGGVRPINTTSPLLDYSYDLVLSPDKRTAFTANPIGDVVARTELSQGEPQPFANQDDARTIALRPDRSLLLGESGGTFFSVPPSGAPLTPFASDPRFAYGRGIAIEPPRCGGRLPTVVGTDGNDSLGGSFWADVFLTGRGKDQVTGYQGNDVICGGSGNDTLSGGPGKDRILGGAGRDRLFGKGGNDRLFGQGGNDRLSGDRGKDRLIGGKGKDKEKQ
jgi:RTX calcium-binding nonapeptide repeat (4 copies)